MRMIAGSILLLAATAVLVWGFRERLGLVPGADELLVGKWIHEEDRTPIEFKGDGTVEFSGVKTTRVKSNGVEIGEPERSEVHSTGQYRWTSHDTIEMIFPEMPVWTPVRVVIEDNRLTLLQQDGGVQRYTRDE